MQDKDERQERERQSRLHTPLQQAQKMEAIGRLAGGVAHDFNNMLSLIIGHAEMAIDRMGTSGAAYEDLKQIKEAAERSAELTRQLLAFARRQTVSPKVLDFNEAVSPTIKMLQRLIGEDIELEWKPGQGLWPVRLDPTQLDQVLTNLCLNARDAIEGVGKVTIETRAVVFDGTPGSELSTVPAGQYVMLAVSDTGAGMSRDVLDHVFEPFFTTKAVGEGTGLGLATVTGIVEQSEGFINVYSEPNVGTTFKLYLPRHDAAAHRAHRVSARAPDIPRGNGETVLLVEDEASILRMGEAMLHRLGYCVLAAQTPREALALAEAHVDSMRLLVTDVVMPEMNGWQLAKRLSALKPGVKCLFVSGYTADVIARRGLVVEDGVEILQKPFSLLQLATKVRAALARDP